jgi:hypothetical protein
MGIFAKKKTNLGLKTKIHYHKRKSDTGFYSSFFVSLFNFKDRNNFLHPRNIEIRNFQLFPKNEKFRNVVIFYNVWTIAKVSTF